MSIDAAINTLRVPMDGALHFSAEGDTLERLQSIATGGQILLSEATRERLEGQHFEPLGPKQVKGKRDAVEVFSLVAA